MEIQSQLLAFTIEIGLKALLYQQYNEFPRIHSIDKLFIRIEAHRKRRIIKYVSGKEKISDENFYGKIKSNSNAFVDWRYFFAAESNLHVDYGFLRFVKEAVVKEIYIDSNDSVLDQY